MTEKEFKEEITRKVDKIYKNKLQDKKVVGGVPLRRWVRYAPRYDDDQFENIDTGQFFRFGNGPIKHAARAMGWTEENVQNWMFKAEDGKTKGRIPELKRLRNYYLFYEQKNQEDDIDNLEKELSEIDKLDATLLRSAFSTTPFTLLSKVLDVDPLDTDLMEMGVVMLGAATFGIPEWLRLALKTGVELPQNDFPHGVSLLHSAARQGNRECVSLLIKHGSNVNAQDDDGETPIMAAIYNDHASTTEILLDNGAYTEGKTVTGFSLREMASKEIEDALDKYSEEDQEDELDIENIIKSDLYEDITNYYGKNLSSITDERGYTPLHIASEIGHIDAIEHFVESDINPDVRVESNGFTPMHLAAREGNQEAIRTLSEAGAKVDPAANHGITPLLLAANNAEENRAEAYFALVEQGAEPSKVFSSGVSDSPHGSLGTLISMFTASFPEASVEEREAIIEAVKDIEHRLINAEDTSDFRSCIHEIVEIGKGYKAFHLANVLIQFVNENYEKDINNERQISKYSAWYDTSGYYNYVNINGTSEIAQLSVEALRYHGVKCIRYDKSHKLASNGKKYDWYIRVETNDGDTPSQNTVGKALLSLQSAGIEFTFDDSRESVNTDALSLTDDGSAKSSDVDDLENEVLELREKLRDLKRELRESKRARDQEEIAHAAEKSDLLSQNAALREKIAEMHGSQLESGDQEQKISNLKNELNRARQKLEEQSESFKIFKETLKSEKDDLQQRINEMENDLLDIRNKKDIYKSELEEKKKEAKLLRRENKRLKRYRKEDKSSELSEADLSSTLEFLFPNLKIKKGSISFLANEVIDPSSALQKLYNLSNNPGATNGSRVRGTDKNWMEIHFSNGQSDAGRMYYRKADDEYKYNVVISHKSTQKRDIRNLD